MSPLANAGADAILQHLGLQDKMLLEIRDEARKTNGRVTSLERDKVRREERERVLAEFASTSDTRKVRRQDRWHWRFGTLVAMCATGATVASVVSALLH